MIELNKMTQNEYHNYMQRAVPDYAEDKIKSGAWKEEEALNRSEQVFISKLPEKQDTINEYLYSVFLEDKTIGYVWFHFNPEESSTAFIYDFLILETYQNKGYGSNTMVLIEDNARIAGAEKIALHVFAHNERAIHVYKSNGFNFTDYSMAKNL